MNSELQSLFSFLRRALLQHGKFLHRFTLARKWGRRRVMHRPMVTTCDRIQVDHALL